MINAIHTFFSLSLKTITVILPLRQNGRATGQV